MKDEKKRTHCGVNKEIKGCKMFYKHFKVKTKNFIHLFVHQLVTSEAAQNSLFLPSEYLKFYHNK
jgi:hypothetical protein